jgi:D-serine deaminase-like pyridoxal phosphate-dependent protein
MNSKQELARELADQLRGRPRDELSTPLALVDLDALERNVATMASRLAGTAFLRPHAKTHKCVEIARRQLAAGALGVTVATAAECIAFARAGVGELLLANEVSDPPKLAMIVEAAALVPLMVAADDPHAVAQLALAAAERGVQIGVLIEVDVGMGRGGSRTIEGTLAVAHAVGEHGALALRGLTGYEGHAVLEPDLGRRTEMSMVAMDLLAEHVEAVRDLGVAAEIVSAGGTNTSSITSTHPIVTELQAGTYALMDTAYAPFAPDFEPALTVLGSVTSRHGSRAILDCGTKVVGVMDLAPASVVGFDATVAELHEEHALLDLGDADLRLRDRVELVVGYCGGTVNLHDYYVVIKDGAVCDVWPIVARGAGWP